MTAPRSVVLNPIAGSPIAPGTPPARDDIADCNSAIAPTGRPADASAVNPFNLPWMSPAAPPNALVAPFRSGRPFLSASAAPPNLFKVPIAPDTLLRVPASLLLPSAPATLLNAPAALAALGRPFITAVVALVIAVLILAVPGTTLVAPGALFVTEATVLIPPGRFDNPLAIADDVAACAPFCTTDAAFESAGRPPAVIVAPAPAIALTLFTAFSIPPMVVFRTEPVGDFLTVFTTAVTLLSVVVAAVARPETLDSADFALVSSPEILEILLLIDPTAPPRPPAAPAREDTFPIAPDTDPIAPATVDAVFIACPNEPGVLTTALAAPAALSSFVPA